MLRTLKILWSGMCIGGCGCTVCRYFLPPVCLSALRVIPPPLCRMEELYQSVSDKVSQLQAKHLCALCNLPACLPACQGLGRAHTWSFAGRGEEMATCDWKKQQTALGQRGRKATAIWASGTTAKPGPCHRLLNLKLGNQKLMCSNWFCWELLSMVHFKIDYV